MGPFEGPSETSTAIRSLIPVKRQTKILFPALADTVSKCASTQMQATTTS